MRLATEVGIVYAGDLAHLREFGPAPTAFTFRQTFPAPGLPGSAPRDADWFCRA